jgi:hypothetical protein
MSKEDQLIDLDTLSDDEFMKLDPSDIQEIDPSSEENTQETEVEVNTSTSSEFEDEDNQTQEPVEEVTETVELENEESDNSEEVIDSNEEVSQEDVEEVVEDSTEIVEQDDTPEKTETEKAVTTEDNSVAIDFYKKITTPFKADGRDMSIRSPEDAIRLMQMGVNYSRRMEEMKPLRAQDRMLKENGLDSPDKLNFAIDLVNGKPEAIKKLLMDNEIDPIDVDISTEPEYQATDYQSDPKDIDFDDAIQETLASEGGHTLINDINKDWDDQSKQALRDQPAIFKNVLAQMQTGVYAKIREELKYQRTMGFLKDIPYLQAYHQVGEAMEKANVFNSSTENNQPVKVTKKVTKIGTGNRKVVHRPKTEQPTPSISSATPPRTVAVSNNDSNRNNEPDYSSMSDEDFLRIAPPG